MIFLIGCIIIAVIVGSVYLACDIVDWINKKFHKDIGYDVAYIIYLVEIVGVLQIFYS